MRHFIVVLCLHLLIACEQHSQNVALGTLERNRISHTATTNEIVVALPIAKGSQVKKGDILVQLDSTQQNAQVARLIAVVAQAQANLDKLKKGARPEEIAASRATVSEAIAKLTESKANYQRTRNLVKDGLSTQAALDHSIASRDSNIANLKALEEQLKVLVNGTRVEDLAIAKANLDAGIAMLDVEKKKLSDLTIRANRDGILDNLPWNLGERVTIGSPVAIVLAGKAPFVRAYIPEPYRVKLKVNDKLEILVDGLENPITGTLRWIANEPAFSPYYALNQQERSQLMYLAEVQLPDSEESLPNGIPSQVILP